MFMDDKGTLDYYILYCANMGHNFTAMEYDGEKVPDKLRKKFVFPVEICTYYQDARITLCHTLTDKLTGKSNLHRDNHIILC